MLMGWVTGKTVPSLRGVLARGLTLCRQAGGRAGGRAGRQACILVRVVSYYTMVYYIVV